MPAQHHWLQPNPPCTRPMRGPWLATVQTEAQYCGITARSRMLQLVAACCGTPQHAAAPRGTPRHVVACCGTPRRPAAPCGSLQLVGTACCGFLHVLGVVTNSWIWLLGWGDIIDTQIVKFTRKIRRILIDHAQKWRKTRIKLIDEIKTERNKKNLHHNR